MKIIKTKHSKHPKYYWIAKALIKLFDASIIFITLGFFWSDAEYPGLLRLQNHFRWRYALLLPCLPTRKLPGEIYY